MRAEVPNPFGTSLIDLLVGALAIVALLWVLNAPNSGYRGNGEKDRSSGMVAIEQFGYPHLKTVRISQVGRFDVLYRLRFPNQANAYMERVESNLEAIVKEKGNSSASAVPTKVIYEIRPLGLIDPIKITLRQVAPSGGFYKGLHVTVEKLDDIPVEVQIGIMPCCSSTQPHYLRSMSMSGNGEREEFSFWHDAGMLEKVLTKKVKPKTGRNSDTWISSFTRAVRKGQDVKLRSFHIAPIDRYYPNISPGRSCQHWQGLEQNNANGNKIPAKQTFLNVVFHPDGDVTISAFGNNEASNSAALGESAYQSFSGRFPKLLNEYVGEVR